MTIRISRDEQLAYYVKQPYATKILVYECDDQPCYMAVHPELDGCMAQGNTPIEAVRNLAEARQDYIAALLDEGIDIPLPKNMRAVSQDPEPGVIVGVATNHPRVPVIKFALNGMQVVSTPKDQALRSSPQHH